MTRDPRLEGKRDGTTLNQAPIQMPANPPVGHKAESMAVLRGPKKLVRKYAQQRINAGKEVDVKLAQRPPKRKA